MSNSNKTVRKLDEETRKKLLGYAPFSTSVSITYTPSQWPDVPEMFRPKFYLRSFTQAELTQLKANYRALTDANGSEIGEQNMDLVRQCVTGWKDLYDLGTCDELVYTVDATGGCDKDQWKRLPVWLVREIMDEVRKMSGLVPVEDLGLK